MGGAVVLIGGGAVGAVAVSGSSQTGPILAFVGVILVALLTAYFANRRQADQLNAEAERQRRQLAHDRQLHDLSELRGVLDEALERAETASHAWLDLYNLATRETVVQDRYEASADAVEQATRRVSESVIRITVRGQDELAVALTEFLGALAQPRRNRTSEDVRIRRAAWGESLPEVTSSHARVIGLARTLVPSSLPERMPHGGELAETQNGKT